MLKRFLKICVKIKIIKLLQVKVNAILTYLLMLVYDKVQVHVYKHRLSGLSIHFVAAIVNTVTFSLFLRL